MMPQRLFFGYRKGRLESHADVSHGASNAAAGNSAPSGPHVLIRGMTCSDVSEERIRNGVR